MSPNTIDFFYGGGGEEDVLGAKSVAQRPIKKNSAGLYLSRFFYLKIVLRGSADMVSILSNRGQEWGGSGYGPYIQRTDSAKRQEGLCQAVPRMLLSPLSWDELRKNPTIKLPSEHTKCSLIYSSSKTLMRIFIRRFWFLSRLERTLIWNYIFRSISARCSLDNLQKLFSVIFLSLVRALSLEIFSSAFYTWDFYWR